MDEEASSTEAFQLRADEHAKSDGGRCLLGGVEVVDEIVGNLAADNIDAARHRLFQPCETRDGQNPRTNAAAHVEFAEGIERQMCVRMIDIAAHRAVRRRVRRHRTECAVPLDLHSDRLLVAAKRRRRDRIAVVPPHCLGDHIRRHRRERTHLTARRCRLNELIHVPSFRAPHPKSSLCELSASFDKISFVHRTGTLCC